MPYDCFSLFLPSINAQHLKRSSWFCLVVVHFGASWTVPTFHAIAGCSLFRATVAGFRRATITVVLLTNAVLFCRPLLRKERRLHPVNTGISVVFEPGVGLVALLMNHVIYGAVILKRCPPREVCETVRDKKGDKGSFYLHRCTVRPCDQCDRRCQKEGCLLLLLRCRRRLAWHFVARQQRIRQTRTTYFI